MGPGGARAIPPNGGMHPGPEALGRDPVRPLSRPRPGPASAERQTRTPNMNGPPMVFIDS